MSETNEPKDCPHCKGPISIRMPVPSSGCDHLYYPENCSTCQNWKDAPAKEEFICENSATCHHSLMEHGLIKALAKSKKKLKEAVNLGSDQAARFDQEIFGYGMKIKILCERISALESQLSAKEKEIAMLKESMLSQDRTHPWIKISALEARVKVLTEALKRIESLARETGYIGIPALIISEIRLALSPSSEAKE